MHNTRLRKSVRRPLTAAKVGVCASVALLVAWTFVRWTGGPARPAASILLEFLVGFVVLFGVLIITAMILGSIPMRGPRMRGR